MALSSNFFNMSLPANFNGVLSLNEFNFFSGENLRDIVREYDPALLNDTLLNPEKFTVERVKSLIKDYKNLSEEDRKGKKNYTCIEILNNGNEARIYFAPIIVYALLFGMKEELHSMLESSFKLSNKMKLVCEIRSCVPNEIMLIERSATNLLLCNYEFTEEFTEKYLKCFEQMHENKENPNEPTIVFQNVFTRELNSTYNAYNIGKEITLPDRKIADKIQQLSKKMPELFRGEALNKIDTKETQGIINLLNLLSVANGFLKGLKNEMEIKKMVMEQLIEETEPAKVTKSFSYCSVFLNSSLENLYGGIAPINQGRRELEDIKECLDKEILKMEENCKEENILGEKLGRIILQIMSNDVMFNFINVTSVEDHFFSILVKYMSEKELLEYFISKYIERINRNIFTEEIAFNIKITDVFSIIKKISNNIILDMSEEINKKLIKALADKCGNGEFTIEFGESIFMDILNNIDKFEYSKGNENEKEVIEYSNKILKTCSEEVIRKCLKKNLLTKNYAEYKLKRMTDEIVSLVPLLILKKQGMI